MYMESIHIRIYLLKMSISEDLRDAGRCVVRGRNSKAETLHRSKTSESYSTTTGTHLGQCGASDYRGQTTFFSYGRKEEDSI
ncbi:hypothetical protein D3C76_1257850 [compost metagenome]